MISASIVGIVCFQWPHFLPPSEVLLAPQRKQITDGIIAAIASHAHRTDTTVMVTTTGFVNADLFNYLGLQRHLPMHCENLAFSGDLQEHRKSWAASDFVVAAKRGNSESVDYVPSYAIQDQILSALRSLPDFAQIAVVPSLNGKNFVVFQNLRPIAAR